MASRTPEDEVLELNHVPAEPPLTTAAAAAEPDGLKDVTDETKSINTPTEEKDDEELTTYPDGGREAWLVVLGGMCAAMGAFGLVASVGAFQTWYENNLLAAWSGSQIAWIGSAQVAVCFSVCFVTGPLFDRYGPRPLLCGGTLLLVFGFCMLSLAKECWQIFLCHAGPIALGMDLVFLPPLSAVGHWFLRRRGLAFGILMTGSSVGAIVWPLLIAHLPQKIGWGWTMRTMALALGVLGTVAALMVKTRLPPKPRGPFFHLGEFRNFAYTAVSMAFPANAFGFFSFLMFIGTYGNVVGLAALAPYLLIISNASSGAGRIVGGLAADYLGVFNVAIAACFGMAVLIFSWMVMDTAASLIVLCIVYGFLSGVPVSLHAPMIMAVISDQRLTGTLIGQSMVVESITSVCAAPIFGLIVGTGTAEEKFVNFKKAIAFGGAMLLLSALLLIPPRLKLNRKLWTVA